MASYLIHSLTLHCKPTSICVQKNFCEVSESLFVKINLDENQSLPFVCNYNTVVDKAQSLLHKN